MTKSPWIWLIAGPNGAGKSTLANEKFASLPLLNADDEARRLAPENPESMARAAARNTMVAVRRSIAGGKTFAVETTLSGKRHSRVIADAKAKGYKVGLIYVCVSDADRAVLRVEQRHREGGHAVPEKDVRRRYDRSLANLSESMRHADVAVAYDNSTPSGFKRVASAERGKLTQLERGSPRWLKKSLRREIEAYLDRER